MDLDHCQQWAKVEEWDKDNEMAGAFVLRLIGQVGWQIHVHFSLNKPLTICTAYPVKINAAIASVARGKSVPEGRRSI